MKLPSILPPSDLLKAIDGIEAGLRRRRQLGILGEIGFLLFSALELLVFLNNSAWLGDIIKYAKSADWDGLVRQWPLLALSTLLVLSILLWLWSRYWLEESKAPFSYTFSVSEFQAIEQNFKENKLSWLRYDLMERLSQRIRRLSLLEQAGGAAPEGVGRASHIHIGGRYLIRRESRDDAQWVAEITPWVRIGPPGSPENLAHPVKFFLNAKGTDHAAPGGVAGAGGPPPGAAGPGHPLPEGFISLGEYEKILERVYFSVATEIYQQIRKDVQGKIDLLPTDYFRATAYFHEAEDHVQSNTLYAYNEAVKLYREALTRYDPPRWAARLKSPWLRGAQAARHALIRHGWQPSRRACALLWPRLGQADIMACRAEVGYANTLISLSSLASLSGHRSRPIYEARPVVEYTLARLGKLPGDIPGHQDCQFDALVSLALATCYLEAVGKARLHLVQAKQLLPSRADSDPRYLYATGLTEGQPRVAKPYYQEAADLDPNFELAQFALALTGEKLWRAHPVLESSIAEMVFAEYDKVIRINPGNLAAWANLGYMHWLLGSQENRRQAKKAFDSGREYKQIKHETFIAELDYGQARIAAEQGDFRAAYEFYTTAISAAISEVCPYSSGELFQPYYFELISETIIERYACYKREVDKQLKQLGKVDNPIDYFNEAIDALQGKGKKGDYLNGLAGILDWVSGRLGAAEKEFIGCLLSRQNPRIGDLHALADSLRHGNHGSAKIAQHLKENPAALNILQNRLKQAASLKIRNSVYAFVLNDYADACRYFYHRSASPHWLAKARSAYYKAMHLDPEFVMPYYNLAAFVFDEPDEDIQKHMDKIRELEPNWPWGQLLAAEKAMALAQRQKNEAKYYFTEAEKKRKEAEHGQNQDDDKKPASRLDTKSEGEAAKAKMEAATLEDEGKKSKTDAENNTIKAEKILIKLLPQHWLWLQGRRPDTKGFNWSALAGAHIFKELKWERELTPLHTRALVALAELYKSRAMESNNLKLKQRTLMLFLYIRKHFIPNEIAFLEKFIDLLQFGRRNQIARDLLEDWMLLDQEAKKYLADEYSRWLAQSRLKALLWRLAHSCIESKNLNVKKAPAFNDARELSLLVTSRLFPPESKELVFRHINDFINFSIIQHWLSADPRSYVPYSWLSSLAPGNFAEGCVAIMKNAIRQPHIPILVYQRLGDQLLQMDGGTAFRRDAYRAYRTAFRLGQRLDEPADLIALAEKFEEIAPDWRKPNGLCRHYLLRHSLACYQRAMAIGGDYAGLTEQGYHYRLGRVLLGLGEYQAATRHFEQGNEQGRTGQTRPFIASALEANREDILKHVHTRMDYYAVKDWLSPNVCPSGQPGTGKSPGAGAHAAILLLSTLKHGEASTSGAGLEGLSKQNFLEGLSLSEPIWLSLADDLIPELVKQGESHVFFKNQIPEMRKNILMDIGIRIPPVRVMDDQSLPPSRFQISLRESPVYAGSVHPGRAFALFAGGPTQADGLAGPPPPIPDADPLTGRQGHWLGAAGVKDLQSGQAEMFDEFRMIARHLESLLRRRLRLFFGIQEFDGLLQQWLDSGLRPAHAEYAKMLRETPDRLVWATGLLASLLDEQVPVNRPEPVLNGLMEAQSKKHSQWAAAALRQSLKTCLPGNDKSIPHYRLKPDFENTLGRCYKPNHFDGALAVDHATLAQLKLAAQSIGQDKKAALIVKQSFLRPLVKHIVAPDCPDLHVLSRDELIPEIGLVYDRIPTLPG